MRLSASKSSTGEFNFLAPISKSEKLPDGRLMVTGIATSEALDGEDEVMDYATAKAAFGEWRGNIREQHDHKKAVGKALEVICDDTAKTIVVKSFVSAGAPDTQAKVLDGTLAFYSIGGKSSGRQAEKVAKGDKTVDASRVFVKTIAEVSLVDSGCNPDSALALVKFDKAGATLEAVNLDDGSNTVKGTPAEVDEFTKALNDAGLDIAQATALVKASNEKAAQADPCTTIDELNKREFSSKQREDAAKSGAAMKDGSFPIENKGDLENAVKAYGRAKNKDAAKAHIVARAKALKATDLLPADWEGSSKEKVQKNMYNVSNFADALCCIANICRSAQYDAESEGDGSEVPKALRNWLDDGIGIFKEMSAEEADELLDELKEGAGVGPDDEIEFSLAMKVLDRASEFAKRVNSPDLPVLELAKLADSNLSGDERKALKTPDDVRKAILSKGPKMDAARMQEIHDHSTAMGASCDSEKSAKGTGDIAKLATTVDTLTKELAEAKKQIKTLEDQPVPHVMLRAVPRGPEPEKTASSGTPSVTLTEKDYIKAADGSIDWQATHIIHGNKLAATE